MSIHTKTNLTCKCLCFERLIAGAATAFDLPPSELVIVDLCSSHAKDLANLETSGVQQSNYYGFDNDVDSPGLAQKYARSSLNLVTCVNLVDASDDDIVAIVEESMRLRGLQSKKAHIILINFAIHLFAKDLDKVFRIAARLGHRGCMMHCSYISYEGLRAVIDSSNSYGQGVTFHKETRTLLIDGMAKYEFDETMRRMVPSIAREENASTFANNGVAESIVSDDVLHQVSTRLGFESICAKDELSHAKLYNDSIRMHVAAHVNERTRQCLEAFLLFHKSILFKHNAV
jgi:hypothetical protein